MNFPFYIARKIGVTSKNSFSNVIIRIAIAAIALSITVMILATATVRGFKSTISEKIFGFWGHIHLTSSYAPSSYAFETSPMNINQDYYDKVKSTGPIKYIKEDFDWSGNLREREQSTKAGLKHIQSFAQKEGIIKANDQIEGIILRGVGKDYDWNFIKKYLKSGDILSSNHEKGKDEILISETTSKRLMLKTGDDFLIYFVQGGGSNARKFKVKGIFKTGLEEYDRRFAIVSISHIQQLNNWRPYRNPGTQIWIEENKTILLGVNDSTVVDNIAAIKKNLKTGLIPESFEGKNFKNILITEKIANERNKKVGDTIHFTYKDFGKDNFTFEYTISGIFHTSNDPSWDRTVVVPWQSFELINQKLPEQISGFEVFVQNMEDLDAFGNYFNSTVLLNKEQYANTIKEIEPNIFDWLNLTDMNERIIMILMILVSIINMTTSLLILILERTNMIGILKALGAKNWTVRTIFLYNAGFIVSRGLLFGNITGIGLCLIQMYFGIVKLPEDLYYVSVAPVKLEFWPLFLLNIGTLVITIIVLIIPSWLVAKIDPVKAIRFK